MSGFLWFLAGGVVWQLLQVAWAAIERDYARMQAEDAKEEAEWQEFLGRVIAGERPPNIPMKFFRKGR